MNDMLKRMSPMTSVQLSYAAQQLRPKLEVLKADPIAIIGMGCRFPGDADNMDSYWRLLQSGKDAISEIPAERWKANAYYDPNPEAIGKMYTRMGGFIKDADGFDAEFFGITPKEMISLDPQQRLLLEVAWEALENANKVPNHIKEPRTGVYIGISTNDYSRLIFRGQEDFKSINAYFGTGNAFSASAGRLAFSLGLNGPCISLDTACSASLVAVHLACQSLRNLECDMALAGGVNLLLAPELFVHFSKARMLSVNGRCKTFDAAADGYGRGDGCGVIVLKRLSDAMNHGDRIQCVIRGSAVNHDGFSGGFTVPNGPAQQAVIRAALESAKVHPDQIGYVEAHGTGTPLGDPIEMGALHAVFGPQRSEETPLVVGSVKTNIGHLEAAAGIAGLIKVVLAMQHEVIPPHLHFNKPNPHIPWDTMSVLVPTEAIPWIRGDKRRIAGVSSFGVTGVNAHVVLEEAPSQTPGNNNGSYPAHLLTLSARTEAALEQLAERYRQHLEVHSDMSLPAVCQTAGKDRTHFDERLGVIAASREELLDRLSAFTTNQKTTEIIRGRADGGAFPKIAFYFFGRNRWTAEAARELYENQPIFRQQLDLCDEILRTRMRYSIVSTLFSDDDLTVSQQEDAAAIFALEYALARMWIDWGVKPALVMGNGLGEYAAACVAGVFSLQDGFELILGQHNFPVHEVLDSGNAFKSEQKRVVLKPSQIPIVTGSDKKADKEILTRGYWKNRIRNPNPSFAALIEEGCKIAIGIGPAFGIFESGNNGGKDQELAYIPSISLKGETIQTLLKGLCLIYVKGGAVNWAGFYRNVQSAQAILPTYPFQHKRFWPDRTYRGPVANMRYEGGGHPLLGRQIHSPLVKERLFDNRLSCENLPFLDDHRVFGRMIVPAAAYLALLIEAGNEIFEASNVMLKEIQFSKSLIVPNEGGCRVQTVVLPTSENVWQAKIISIATGHEKTHENWTLHTDAKIISNAALPATHIDVKSLLDGFSSQIPSEALYHEMARRGFDIGPSFRWIEQIWKDEQEIICRVQQPNGCSFEGFLLFPGLIDSCFQCLCAAYLGKGDDSYVPFSIDQLKWYGASGSCPSGQMWCKAKGLPEANGDRIYWNITLFQDDGTPLLEMERFEARRATRQELLRASEQTFKNRLYQVKWKVYSSKTTSVNGPMSKKRWILFADKEGYGDELADRMTAEGAECIRVYAGDRFQVVDNGRINIRPWKHSDYRRVFEIEPNSEKRHFTGVIHLWSLDDPVAGDLTTDRLTGIQDRGCNSVLALVKTLAEMAPVHPPRIWIATGNVHCVEKEDIPWPPTHASLWGLGRVVALEYPEFDCTLVDLDRTIGKSAVSDLFAILKTDFSENQLAIREGKHYVCRLVHATASTYDGACADGSMDTIVCKEECTYLITGGLGALGRLVANRLADCGARHLILIGRHGAETPAARAAVKKLESDGVEVIAPSVDIASYTEVKRLIERIKKERRTLKGVIHAAGVLGDGVLSRMDWERFTEVLAPKMAGAWNLHLLTHDLNLDFFVCFSSAVSLFGAPGQSSYAAANTFLDALAHYRKSQGLPCLSINWGPWEKTGMTAELSGYDAYRLSIRGIKNLDPADGMAIFDTLLRSKVAQAGVLNMNWNVFLKQFSFPPPFYSELMHFYRSTSPRPALLSKQLAKLPDSEHKPMLIAHLQRLLCEVMGLGPDQAPSPNEHFFDMGMDSLMTVELTNKLNHGLATPLSSTLLFSFSNIEDMAEYLLSDVLASHPLEKENVAEETAVPEYSEMAENLNTLDDEEVLARISNEFKNLFE